jgi:hypothetical protein
MGRLVTGLLEDFFADCFAGFFFCCLCCLTVFAARDFLATVSLAVFLEAGFFVVFAFLAAVLAAGFFTVFAFFVLVIFLAFTAIGPAPQFDERSKREFGDQRVTAVQLIWGKSHIAASLAAFISAVCDLGNRQSPAKDRTEPADNDGNTQQLDHSGFHGPLPLVLPAVCEHAHAIGTDAVGTLIWVNLAVETKRGYRAAFTP